MRALSARLRPLGSPESTTPPTIPASRACLWHGIELLSTEQILQMDAHYGQVNVDSMREWALLKFAELHADRGGVLSRKHPVSPTLSLSEFARFMTYFGLKGSKSSDVAELLYNAVDVDGDGAVDFDEFFRWILTMRHGKVADKITFGFRLVDVNRDGDVEKDELKAVLLVMFGSLTAMGLAPPDNISGTIESILTAFPDGKPIALEDYRRFCLDETTPIHTGAAAAAEARGESGVVADSLFGQEKWEFMLSVMIAIHTAVSQSTTLMADNGATPSIEFDLPCDEADEAVVGSIRTYTPTLWRKIRAQHGISDAQLLSSLGFEQVVGSLMLGDLAALSGHVSEGRSGSFFFFSGDSKFMVKTISAAESKALRAMTPDLLAHVESCPETMLAPICGHFKLKQHKLAVGSGVSPSAKKAAANAKPGGASGKRKPSLFAPLSRRRSKSKSNAGSSSSAVVDHVYFVIMRNVFALPPIERFDLKGSTRNRQISEAEREDADVVRKDNDFLELRGGQVGVGPGVVRLRRTLLRDVALLRKHRVVDYSALVGVLPKAGVETPGLAIDVAVNRHIARLGSGTRSAGTLLPSHSVGMEDDAALVVGAEYYQVSIIDYLVPFDQRKNAEFALKRTIYGPGGSVMPSSLYADRFEGFMEQSIRFCAVPTDAMLLASEDHSVSVDCSSESAAAPASARAAPPNRAPPSVPLSDAAAAAAAVLEEPAAAVGGTQLAPAAPAPAVAAPAPAPAAVAPAAKTTRSAVLAQEL